MASPGNRRVAITGLSGFTGAWLAPKLLDKGWQVFGMGLDGQVPGVAFTPVDLDDRASIAAWLDAVQPSHIIHLAARSHVVGDALGFFQTNVLGTENLLLALDDCGVDPQKIILASSANVYGNSPVDPITEDTPARPANHYALSKIAMELLAGRFFHRRPILITRPFNYTGPGQSESFVFAKLAAAFARREPVIRLGNQAVARDLSHVSYVCDSYAALLDCDAHSTSVNLCSGQAVSIGEAIAMLRELTGHDPHIETDPALVRPDDMLMLRGSPARLQALVGPLPCPSPREILADMVAAVS